MKLKFILLSLLIINYFGPISARVFLSLENPSGSYYEFDETGVIKYDKTGKTKLEEYHFIDSKVDSTKSKPILRTKLFARKGPIFCIKLVYRSTGFLKSESRKYICGFNEWIMKLLICKLQAIQRSWEKPKHVLKRPRLYRWVYSLYSSLTKWKEGETYLDIKHSVYISNWGIKFKIESGAIYLPKYFRDKCWEKQKVKKDHCTFTIGFGELRFIKGDFTKNVYTLKFLFNEEGGYQYTYWGPALNLNDKATTWMVNFLKSLHDCYPNIEYIHHELLKEVNEIPVIEANVLDDEQTVALEKEVSREDDDDDILLEEN
jgi:hypothetical protein